MSAKDAFAAYGRTAQAAQQPQQTQPGATEAWALVEAARRMASAIEAYLADPEAARRPMQDALRLNWKLWTIFQANLTTDSVQVPEAIKINMLTLCKFVDAHTAKAIPDPTPERLATLININRNIASGLMGIDGADRAAGEDERTYAPSLATPTVMEQA